MKSIVLLIINFVALVSWAQENPTETLLDSSFVNGKLESFSTYDSANLRWKKISLYPDGQIHSIRFYDTSGYRNIDQTTVYYRSGNLCYLLNFEDSAGLLNGAVVRYYPSGKMKFSGSFYKGFKSGEWLYYDSTGTVDSSVHQDFTYDDSIRIWTVDEIVRKEIEFSYNHNNKGLAQNRHIYMFVEPKRID